MSTTTGDTTEGSADHSHAHHHGAAGSTLSRAFAVGVALNVTFVVVEAIYGIAAHSTALLADSAHNASDVLGLGLAWIAASLARRKPSLRHTYGLRASTVLAALTNAVLLLVAVGGVSWEAIRRLVDPDTHHVEGLTVLAVAAVGVVINAASALLFLRGRKDDANVRAAFLHLAADAGVSLGVVVAGAAIMKTGWDWLDPAVSLAVSIVVLVSTWELLRDALHLALAGVPSGVNVVAVQDFLQSLPGVCEVHDLHIWPMGTTEVALTAHLVLPWTAQPPSFLQDLEHELKKRFGIDHATVQLEPQDAGTSCELASSEVV